MQADRFKRLQDVFIAALEHEPGTRAGFVARLCENDAAMAREVLELLAFEASVGSVETQRPFALVAEAVAAAETKSMVGKIVGRYRLEAEIASGGMGRVFKASRIDDLAQTVALKLVRHEIFNDLLLRRFSAERRILASLNHPGIAHLIDAGTDENGTPFVAMEYVDGLPLLDHCERVAASIRDRLMLFRQILAAVSHAHRNLVVHRDLKPENILVTADGWVKLLDFGVAKALEARHVQTATAESFFTPAYAAPEQLLKRNITVSCDVYALGGVLYTLLAGAPPFDVSTMGAGEMERHILLIPPEKMRVAATARGAQALRNQGIADPARWAEQLDGDLENIVQKALRKEPNARYGTADQLDDDIERFLAQRPVAASGNAWAYRARKFLARHAAVACLAVMVLVLGLVGVAKVVAQNHQIRSERDRARLSLEVLRNSFRLADPMQPDVGDIRARTILKSAAREVGALKAHDPRLFQDLAYEIGGIQLDLGMTHAGLDLIRSANRLENEPSDSGVLLEVRALIMASRLVDAHAMLDANRARLGASPEFMAEDAHLLYLERHYAEAIALCKRLFSGASTLAAPVRDRVYWYLAESYRKSERFEEAVAIIDKQIAEQRKRYGSDHPLTLMSRLRRAELLSETGASAFAERELIAIKPMLDRYYDQASAVQGHYHGIFGQMLAARNRRAEALEQFRQALAADEIALGPDHQNTLREHFNIALMIAYDADDRREAYPHFSKAITGVEKKGRESYGFVGFFRLEEAKSHFWDKDMSAAKTVLAPPHALLYFDEMAQVNQKEYLEALYYGFGVQNCKHGQDGRGQTGKDPNSIAKALLCRYDLQGRYRLKR